MKVTLKSSTVLLGLALVLHDPIASADPKPGSPAYEATAKVAAEANAGSSAYNSPVFAVPEADTYAMMLAGLGLVGFMVYRRRNL